MASAAAQLARLHELQQEAAQALGQGGHEEPRSGGAAVQASADDKVCKLFGAGRHHAVALFANCIAVTCHPFVWQREKKVHAGRMRGNAAVLRCQSQRRQRSAMLAVVGCPHGLDQTAAGKHMRAARNGSTGGAGQIGAAGPSCMRVPLGVGPVPVAKMA